MCKTLYAITEDEKAERILVTKTRDLNNCQERVMKDIGLAYVEKLTNHRHVSLDVWSDCHVNICKGRRYRRITCRSPFSIVVTPRT